MSDNQTKSQVAEFYEEFVEYIQGAGADELRESAVFNSGDVKHLKPVRERVVNER